MRLTLFGKSVEKSTSKLLNANNSLISFHISEIIAIFAAKYSIMWEDLSFKERAELINRWHKEHVTNYAEKKRKYDEAHKFDGGGDTQEYYAGELPEIVSTPTKESISLRKRMQNIIKDPVLRKQFYGYILNSDKGMRTPIISDNEKLLRFVELYRASDSPRIHVTTPHDRPHYWDGIPFVNGMYIPTSYYNSEEKNSRNIVSELSHAYQCKNSTAEELGLKPAVGRFLKQAVGRIFDDDGMYERLGNYEFDAHSLIEPTMHDYISGRTNDFEGQLKDVVQDAWESPEWYSKGVDKYASQPKKQKSWGGYIGLDFI